MPTLVEFDLKKDGSGDYTTIKAFLAAEVNGNNLVSLDQVIRLNIFKAGWDAATPLDENFVEITSGTTTDATRRVEYVVVSADRHDFTADTGFVFSPSTGFGFVNRSNHVLIDWFEIAGATNTSSMWHSSDNAIANNFLNHGINSSSILLNMDVNNAIFYDFDAIAGNIPLEGCTTNNVVVVTTTGFGGALGKRLYRTCAMTDCLGYKEEIESGTTAFSNCTGDFNGINQTGQSIPGASSVENLTTADFNDFANKDFRTSPTSAFATNGSGGSFMGAALAPSSGTNWNAIIKDALDNGDVVLSAGNTVATITLPAFASYDTDVTETITWTIPAASLTTSATPVIATPTHTITPVSTGITAAITETGPSFTESISATLTASISAAITESGPSFTESINTTLSVNITSAITEVGPSFTESINATITSTATLIASITEQGPSFTESITANLDVNLTAAITELGPSFTESISVSLLKDITATITETGPSFVESIIASIPVVITVNPKNIIKVKSQNNTITVKRKSNTVIIKRKSNIIRVK